MTSPDHRRQRVASVACAVITVSDTRTPESDGSGSLIRQRLEAAGHTVISYEILPDQPANVRERAASLCDEPRCRAVLLNGGTGLAARDTTYEAVDALLEKRITGFGELFRMLSFQEVGAAAMLSRACAGVARGTLVFAMPGAPDAVRLAMDRLILPELNHMAALLDDGA